MMGGAREGERPVLGHKGFVLPSGALDDVTLALFTGYYGLRIVILSFISVLCGATGYYGLNFVLLSLVSVLGDATSPSSSSISLTSTYVCCVCVVCIVFVYCICVLCVVFVYCICVLYLCV